MALNYLGSQSFTNLASVVTLTPPSGSSQALILVEGKPVRWSAWPDANPTATTGNPLAAGASFTWDAVRPSTFELYDIRFIEQTPGAAIYVTYYA